MIRAGKLRHLVSFQVPLVEIDSNGDTTQSWEDAFDGQQISAQIEPLSGRELIAAQQVHSQVSTRITVRYRPGIVPEMRLLHRGTVYNIEAVIPDPDSGFRHATLMCTSGTNDG
jgi:SPP1 family predicted phage head-tail adaptor